MLVLSLPTLAWADLYQGDTPALDALLDESAVGACRCATSCPARDAGDGYATIERRHPGPGRACRAARCSSPTRTSSATPPDGVPAQHRRRPARGWSAWPSPAVVERNEELDYDAEIGALGEALDDAGVPRAVIANADGQGRSRAPDASTAPRRRR